MTKVSYDAAAMEDGETLMVHENGRVLEMTGEQSNGEWFAYNGDGSDKSNCFAQGYYESDGEVDVMQDEDGNELARFAAGDDEALLAWAEQVLA